MKSLDLLCKKKWEKSGLTVEIYTRSSYTTSDMALIISDREAANSILLELGFIQEDRHWYHEHK